MEEEAKHKVGLSDLDIKSILKENKELRNENKKLKKIFYSQMPPPERDSYNDFDIRKVAERSSFHKSFFHKVPFVMWSKNLKGEYVAVNSSFEEKSGKTQEEIIGQTDFDLFPVDFAEKNIQTDKDALQLKDQVNIELEIPTIEGRIWYEVIKVPQQNDQGQFVGVSSFAREITQRKKYETALKHSESKFRELAENVSDSFILWQESKVLYANPAFEKIYGYSREYLYENPMASFDWIYPNDKERILKVFNSKEYKSSLLFDQQYRIIKKNGEKCWIWNRSYPLHGDSDSSRIVSVATDITEIKRLESNLRVYQYEQQAILDNIPHHAWMKNSKGEYISANKSFCKYFNLSPEELKGKKDSDLVDKQLAHDYLVKDTEVMKSGKQKLFYEVENGKIGVRYSETYKTPLMNEANEVIGVAGISRDVTANKLAESALIKSEEKYKDLVNLLPEVVFEADENGIITFVNLKGLKLSGYSKSDLSKEVSIFDVITHKEREMARECFKKAKQGQEYKGLEFQLITKPSKILPILVFTNNMYQDGKWCGVRGVLVDNSSRKESERQEAVYQSKLVYLSDTALALLSMNSEDNIYKFIGQKVKSLLGDVEIIISSYSDESLSLKLVYNSFSKSALKKMQKILADPSSRFEYAVTEEIKKNLKKNSDHLVELKGGFSESTWGKIAVKDSQILEDELEVKKFYGMTFLRDDNLYGSILILSKRDKLEDRSFIEALIYQAAIALHRRQLETELIKAKTLAEESDELKTAFLANMSHEIRTPMNGILGLSQLLTKSNVTDVQRKEYISMINSNGTMLMALVNDIIDISKIESKQVDLFESEFSLNQLMNDLYCFISAEKMVKDMSEVDLSFKPVFKNGMDFIISDQAKIKQILTNLIGNAVKFTTKGGIDFGYKLQDENTLLFYVDDSGIGIPEDKLEVIFERFIQADQSLTRPFSGSGLGLAISKGFVDRIGGKIWAKSEQGKGSSFYFTIPYKAVKKAVKLTRNVRLNISQFEWENITILVVEDNLISFKLLEISLKKTGCNIIHAENGRDAITMVEENPEINLVLMDIQLPVMNGYESTRKIKKIRPKLHVIAQTANAMDDDRLKCAQAGCSDYVTKPILIDKLLPVIEKYIG